MKHSKIIAIAAVALMLCVPLAIAISADDVSATDIKAASKAVYVKSDKTMDKTTVEKIFTTVGVTFSGRIAVDIVPIMGFDSEIYASNASRNLKVTEFTLKSLESGVASKVADSTLTNYRSEILVGSITMTCTPDEDLDIASVLDNRVDSAKASPIIEKALGTETFKAGTPITLKADFTINKAISQSVKYVKIGDGNVLISSGDYVTKSAFKIQNGEVSVGDKKYSVDTDLTYEVKGSEDLKLTKDSKTSDGFKDPTVSYTRDGKNIVKIKTDTETDVGANETDSQREIGIQAKKNLMNSLLKDTKVGDADDPVMTVVLNSPTKVVADEDIVPSDVPTLGNIGTTEQKLKDNGITYSDKFDDVKTSAEGFLNESSGKSPVLFIVIAVVAVIVVAGVVLAVMKKKSA